MYERENKKQRNLIYSVVIHGQQIENEMKMSVDDWER